VKKQKPESIENRWDVLYRDYPEVYDEFAVVPRAPSINAVQKFHLEGKIIADIGSGTGDSSFEYAKSAKEVVGIEIEKPMLNVAEKLAKERNIKNVKFVLGDARKIPLEDGSVDAVIGATLAINPPEEFKDFVKEAERVTRNGGVMILTNIAPGWYGGELNKIIGEDNSWDEKIDQILEDCRFEYEDLFQDQEYGSLDKIIRTYGFIFGKKAIEYLKTHTKTNIKWKLRIRYKKVEK